MAVAIEVLGVRIATYVMACLCDGVTAICEPTNTGNDVTITVHASDGRKPLVVKLAGGFGTPTVDMGILTV